jgi:Ca2+-binding RTX toxin-like protein
MHIWTTMRPRATLLAAAVVAVALIVPAPMAFAGAEASYMCDGIIYDDTDPAHVLYGAGIGTEIVDGRLVVDLTGADGPRVVFWSGGLSFGMKGALIDGSKYDDVICGTYGDDEIDGRKGNDRIFGQYATGGGPAGLGDVLVGGEGSDLIFNGHWIGDPAVAPGYVKGGLGDDSLYSGDAADTIVGNDGADLLDAVTGGCGAGAVLMGGPGDDTLVAGDCDATELYGRHGADTLTLGGGAYQLAVGGAGEDEITGGSGPSQDLFGKMDADLMTAGTGEGQDLLGGPGDDEILGMGAGPDQDAWGGSDDDTITAFETAVGFFATGDLGDDTITGGPDADYLYGGPDNDTIDGGAGADTLSGWIGNDTVMGGEGADTVDGGDDDDILWGGPGADDLDGGTGTNVLYGNAPDETFQLDIADGETDTMTAASGDTAATSNTFFGSCDALDVATDTGDGTADASYTTTDNTGIENATDACVIP